MIYLIIDQNVKIIGLRRVLDFQWVLMSFGGVALKKLRLVVIIVKVSNNVSSKRTQVAKCVLVKKKCHVIKRYS